LGAWGNLDQVRRELNELDISLQGDWAAGVLSGDLGYTHLRYPHRVDWEPTHEVFADLALDRVLQPSMSVHWDVDKGRGRYWTLGLSHDVSALTTSVGLSAKLYGHEHYYRMTGISALETGVSVTEALGRLSFHSGLARLWTWQNGDFHDDSSVSPGWLLSLTVSPH
jgi:hypothetical protein